MAEGTILVVDDELLIRDLLYEFFTQEGYQVILAEDGERALELIEKQGFDVSLVDLKMPGVDGMEVVRAVHRLDPDLPVIIMTGYPSFNSAVEALRQGVYDYVVKPFKVLELMHMVERAIKEYRQVRQNRELSRKLAEVERQLQELQEKKEGPQHSAS